MRSSKRKWLGSAFMSAVTVLMGVALSLPAQAEPTGTPIIGEIERIEARNLANPYSQGTIVVGGQNVIIPRNLVIDLPANRLTLQELFAQAPPECLATNETGLAKGEACVNDGTGAHATILANRTNGGDIIAGEVLIEKGLDAVTGTVTYINYTDGYFRLNGNGINSTQSDDNTGVMVRINDPTSRFTIQQGPGCIPGAPNCSADERFGVDSDNYTVTFTTGYPACIPSTQVTGNVLPSNRTTPGLPDGTSDPFCPDTNRPAAAPQAAVTSPDSTRFAPIKLGDNVSAEGNFETITGTRFLSAHTAKVFVKMLTQDSPNQPDYMIFDEVEIDVPGFDNRRARALFIGFTTLDDPVLGSLIDIYSLHKDPTTNVYHEVPLASTVNNPTTTRQGVIPNQFNIFKIRYDVDFIRINPLDSPCVNLGNAFPPATGVLASFGLCQNSGSTADDFAVLSPVCRDIQGRTRHSAALNPGVVTLDINGNLATNGQYLNPVGLVHPEAVEINLAALQKPYIFEGIPWNLDRRLSPEGCVGACETRYQPLRPFPYSGLDPRTQSGTPGTVGAVPATADRILAFHPFGPGDFLPLALARDPAPLGIIPTPPLTLICNNPNGRQLNVARAEFSTLTNRWIVSGSFGGNGSTVTLTLYAGRDASGSVIGTATVDPFGLWLFRQANSPVVPDATNTVSIVPSVGNPLLAVQLKVR